MEQKNFLVEPSMPLCQSVIWNLNRNYYQQKGIDAWRENEVPHHMTSNAFVGKTYAELIFAALQDLNPSDYVDEPVYILELGAGHGRLCYHILQHLNKRIKGHHSLLPSFCFILSDIVDKNLEFFIDHPQLKKYFDDKKLDVAKFDATSSTSIELMIQKKTINKDELRQPLIVIGNYFFDSIPFDLFKIDGGKISETFIKTESKTTFTDPYKIPLEDIELAYSYERKTFPNYSNETYDDILKEYSETLEKTFLMFPHIGLDCLSRLQTLSKAGLIVITMDKGIQHLQLLNNKPKPDWITHGSFSFTVNYHAFIKYAQLSGGSSLFCKYSNFFHELGCVILPNQPMSIKNLEEAYRLYVDDYSPDDFYCTMKFSYENMGTSTFKEIIPLIRHGAYDSTLFEKSLPRVKALIPTITYGERDRVFQTINRIWDNYFDLGETDLAFELGGIMYDLGFFMQAIDFFEYSVLKYGYSQDSYYNQALCYFQLNKDTECMALVEKCQSQFPEFEKIKDFYKLIQG